MKKRSKRIITRGAEILISVLIVLSVIGTAVWGILEMYNVFMGNEEHHSSEISVAENSNPNWNLILINRENPIPEGFEVELAETENGHKVDKRIKEPLEQMLSDARKAGIIPKITSSYRTTAEQKQLLDEKTAEYINEGYNPSAAAVMAEKWVALPDTSEHQTGLAVDISTADWEAQSAYTVWEWLGNNCHKYGFILRYTEEKEDITGIIPEPWHFRYVGIDIATEIMNSGVCLEEYLGK